MVKTIMIRVNDDIYNDLVELKDDRTWEKILYDGVGYEGKK